jgi:pilus assembly protein TadC
VILALMSKRLITRLMSQEHIKINNVVIVMHTIKFKVKNILITTIELRITKGVENQLKWDLMPHQRSIR